MRKFLILALLSGPVLFAADPIAQVLDDQVKAVDHDVVRLAEAMPADKYSFAPTNGTFTGVRTFGAQVKHLATRKYLDAWCVFFWATTPVLISILTFGTYRTQYSLPRSSFSLSLSPPLS